MNNDENITIRDLKENIFYVHKLSTTLMDDNSQEKAVRKVRVGIMDNKNEYFYRRLLACLIILNHSQEFQKYHSNFFEEIIKEVSSPYPLSSLQSISDRINFNRENINALEIPSKPVAYLLFCLISFYNLNNLLNDFYIIFNRTFEYEKQQYETQNWDSLIKDDFLLGMLIFGLDELELCGTSKEYFESLQDRYIEKQKFYHQVIEKNNLKVTSELYRSINADDFLIEDGDRIILEGNELFTYLKNMTPKEKTQTEALILSLFVFKISKELPQKIYKKTMHGKYLSRKTIELAEALETSLIVNLNCLKEYTKLQGLEQVYRYIDGDIATTFADKDISCKLKPFFH